ncbi:MAG: isoprenylcysteine carboxylmethyltransferase family protein [Firmicutes bacterium]|nr:isoprenylcysteine carboxylmethyltransferase family protein [Bacillota bacterium]
MLLSLSRLVIIGALIFLTAGRINYWQGWLYIIVHLLMFAVSIPLFAGKAELINERLNPGGPAKKWDIPLVGIMLFNVFAVIIIAALDSGRFHWTKNLPAASYISGWILYAAGVVFSVWAMYINRFFSSIVRIQTDRGHTVIKEGPYKIVRHPGYLGMIVLTAGLPLCMGSYYAFIPSAIIIIVTIIRTNLEDKTLGNELEGYVDYSKTTRYKIIPGIW